MKKTKTKIVKPKFTNKERIKEHANRMTLESTSLFVCAILEGAVEDYNSKETIDFFNSKFGKQMVDGFNLTQRLKYGTEENLTPEVILRQLQKREQH